MSLANGYVLAGLGPSRKRIKPLLGAKSQKSVEINEEEFAKFFTDNHDNCIKGLSTDNLQQERYTFWIFDSQQPILRQEIWVLNKIR